jgi:SAM-dependent methyltransferase
MTAPCLCCGSATVRTLVDFGVQPPSNRFEHPDETQGDRHRLVVGQCTTCGLMQLVDPLPFGMAKSRFEWLAYNEPEGHLDDLVGRLRALPGIGPRSRIIGLTYKDDSTLVRFNRLGHGNTYRYEMAGDLGISDPCAGLESVQSALDGAMASRLAEKHGRADLLLARHVLEHAHDPGAFFTSLRSLVRPGGYLLLEVPDCTKFVRACDHSFIWEEHVLYFCAPTLVALVRRSGVVVHETIVYPYPLEDSLIGIVKNEPRQVGWRPAAEELNRLLDEGQSFSRGYAEIRERLQRLFRRWRQQDKRVAIFGAGHLAAKFTNMYGLAGYIDCVVDDNVNKQALLMPGSRLRIVGSAALAEMDLCLLSLNPESEQKVLAKNRQFIDRGVEFMSIFALSPRAVHRAAGK